VTRHGLAQHRLAAAALVGLGPLIRVPPATMVNSPTRCSTAGIAVPEPLRSEDYTARNIAQMEGAATRRATPKPLSP
jgi:hypothetical protein